MLIDGPASSWFKPVLFEGTVKLTDLNLFGVSEKMAEAAKMAPVDQCVAWGIPFVVNQVIVLNDKPVEIDVDPFKARWIVFMHTSDQRIAEKNKDGFITPLRGEGFLGELAATYHLCYTDGSESQMNIIRRRHVGAFQRHWGENCFEAVAATKPHSIHAAHEQLREAWGFTQTRVDTADYGEWVNWLWAWETPSPEKTIKGFRFEPGAGKIVLSGISAGDVTEQPLRWGSRKKAIIALNAGQPFLPDLDDHGCLKQLKLDLGQIISARPRLLYPDKGWAESNNNSLPQLSKNELLVEYTCHPDACFHFEDGQIIPVHEIRPQRDTLLSMVQPAAKTVRLRIVDKITGEVVPVKLHIHGEAGEYLAPVDRHRIVNPAWFEDYGPEYLHFDWERPGVSHPCTYISGETLVKLPLGNIYIEISKGFEVKPVRLVFEVLPSTDEIIFEIEKVLPWREKGWVTADTHVHFLSPITAMLEGAAEGVNIINLLASQWGELMTNVGDFDGHHTWGSKENGGNGEYLVRVGTENRQHVLGHISLLGYRGNIIAPMTVGGPDESALGDPVDCLLTEWARQCRSQEGLVVLPHFPNPRAEHAVSIVGGDIDAIEMTSWENVYQGIDPYSLSDWYRYLNCGYMVPVVGGTDKMSAATAVGTVRTYAWLDPRIEFTYETWKEAVRKGDTFVTYGPLLEFNVDGHTMGSRFMLSSNGGTVQVPWQVASVTVPMTRVELIVNGEIVESTPVSSQDGSGTWSYKVKKSCWLALLVRGHEDGHPEIVAAHSSPVMIQVIGSPLIAAADAVTILDQIEGSLAYIDTIGTRAEDRVYKKMRLILDSAYRSLHQRMHQAGYFHDHGPQNSH